MSVYVLSHLELAQASVAFEHFVVTCGGIDLSAPEFVPDWDYASDVRIEAGVRVDLRLALESASLDEAELNLSILWHATGSGLRGSSDPVMVRDGLNTVVLKLAGGDLGGVLVLDVTVTLARGVTETGLAAKRPGSMLWSQERRVRLEGEGSRFPITHLSFSDSGLVDGLRAAWILQFESADLFDSGLGNVRLFLNTDHPGMQAFIADPASEPVLQQALRYDINRQFVHRALSSDDLDLDTIYPTDSLGELLRNALHRNFPNQPIEVLRARLRNAPGEFDGHIQARGGFLL